jgi:hypothetical protein
VHEGVSAVKIANENPDVALCNQAALEGAIRVHPWLKRKSCQVALA